ncbi:MAG: hypothetical protein WC874_04920, partial [Candidatus Izemoplasmatales bacterium]
MANKIKNDFVDIDSIRLRKMSDGQIIKRLFFYVKPFFKPLFFAIFMVLLLVGLDIISPLLFAEVINQLSADQIDGQTFINI